MIENRLLKEAVNEKDEIILKIKEIEKMLQKRNNEILEAIKKQRWYFFKNKSKVIFDKVTGILWPNLDCFKFENYKVDVVREGFLGNKCISSSKTVEEINIDLFNNWEVPTLEELKGLIEMMDSEENTNFKKIIENNGNLAYSQENNICGFNLRIREKMSGNYYLLPCYRKLVDENYKINISKNNRIYNEKEKLNMTLNIFIENGLEPIFDDEKITELYREVYIEKPKLIERLNELNKLEIINKDENNQLLELKSREEFIKKYNVEESDKSLSLYYKNAKELIDDFLMILDNLNKDSYIIKVKNNYLEFNEFILNMELNKELNEDEKNVFKKRKEFLIELINIDIDEVIRKLEKIKNEVDLVNLEIKNIINSENFLIDLARLEQRKRPTFKLFLDYSYNIVEEIMNSIFYINKEEEKLNRVINIDENLTEKYIEFNRNLSIDFTKMHLEEDISYEELEKWANQFNYKNILIEEEITKLLKMSLKNDLNLDILDSIVEVLISYKDNLSEFYKKDKKAIYQKYAFETAGEEKEEIESKVQLNNINNRLEIQLRKIIFNIDNLNSRCEILKWSETLVNNPIDDVIDFINDKENNNSLINIMNDFDRIRKENFTAYIEDLQSYAEARSEREKEYNSLMFRLKQDLNNRK